MPRLFWCLLGSVWISILLTEAPLPAAEQRLFISIPTIGVSDLGGKSAGTLHYLAIQIDVLSQPVGPEIQFNEGSRALGRLKGGALSQDWKAAALIAVRAAAQAVNVDPRTWMVTIKNVSDSYITDGASASAALAVAIVAAQRGTTILPGISVTGAIDTDGRISAVGGIPEKIQGAAAGGLSTILIPTGQTRTSDWDIRPLAESLRLTVIEVRTLHEAYEKMTGRGL